jgi:hypothetical protein
VPDDLSPKTGFVQYTGAGKFVTKSNTLRYVKSMTGGVNTVPLEKAHVLFTTAEELNNEPASCYNCRMFYDKAERCAIHLPSIQIKKFVGKAEEGGKDIEFWPCCGYQDYGEPSHDDWTLLDQCSRTRSGVFRSQLRRGMRRRRL